MILSVETATRRGSVCLTRGNELMASTVGEDMGSHSNTLLRQISEVLEQGQAKLPDVDLFAAAIGPGSFTGLRIGLATIKGLAATLGKPSVGIPTLEAVARAGGASALTVALLPAGRGELFAQKFTVTTDGIVTALDNPGHIDPETVRLKYGTEPNVHWCGEGAHAHRDEISLWAEQNGFSFNELRAANTESQTGWTLAPQEFQLAGHIAALAQVRLLRNETVDPNSLTALYVRPSDAELKYGVPNAISS